MKKILVLNPNSSTGTTAQMQEGCRSLQLHPDHELVFETLAGGPAGIETQRDVESVVIPTCDYCLNTPADAYVIGCFSDPGLALLREEIDKPAVGIAESAFLAALGLGGKFGIVSIKSGSFARHTRAVRALGLIDRLAGDRALGLGVAELLDDAKSMARIVDVGRTLRDKDGAEVLILGCATMGVYRARIEDALAMPVVDPTQAAVMRASALLAMNYTGNPT